VVSLKEIEALGEITKPDFTCCKIEKKGTRERCEKPLFIIECNSLTDESLSTLIL